MQVTTVMAFRKRLKNRGYADISIKKVKDKNNYYVISAVEPLAKVTVSVEYYVGQMNSSFR